MMMVSIGEIARRAGVAASTIRYYERIGLLPPPQRVSGKRRYDLSMLAQLALIHLAQGLGFSLAEIRELVHGFAPDTPPAQRWRTFATAKIAALTTIIAEAQRRKTVLEHTQNCRCATLEACAGQLSHPTIPESRAP